MDPDVTNGRGEVARQIEQRLGFPATVGSARDALAEGENAHELSVRSKGDGHHRLQHGHLPGDLARGSLGRLRVGFFDLDEPAFRHQPEG